MPKPSQHIALLGALAGSAALAAGCGSSAAKTTQAHPTAPQTATAPTATSTHATTIPSEGNGGATAPTSPSGVPQPNPSGPATLSVDPTTAAPGRTVTATLHAPAGTRVATVTLSGTGGSASAAARPSGGGAFVATLVVPMGLKGGFWPVVAHYGSSSETNSVTAQVKVFTP